MFIENENISEFEIFSARMSDINDPAYHIDFSAPDSFEIFLKRNNTPTDTKKIITLTICVGANNDKRMIVQGALRSVVPVSIGHSETGWSIIKPD